jgi:hypothetical protein
VADQLETILRDLGAHLDVPPPPDDLADAVAARLTEPRRGHPVLVRVAAVVVALLVALGVAMAVSPTVRATVFDLLRIGGVEITDAPAPAPRPTAPLPGERSATLAEARAAAAFDLRVPEALGDPDAVTMSDGTPPRVVSFQYPGVRVDQFDGGLSPVFEKFVAAEDVRRVRVGDTDGVWIPRPHQVIYVARDGTTREESARLAANTLVWTDGRVTYRIEGSFTAREAVAIAESMR